MVISDLDEEELGLVDVPVFILFISSSCMCDVRKSPFSITFYVTYGSLTSMLFACAFCVLPETYSVGAFY
jgi:hypothetical protein